MNVSVKVRLSRWVPYSDGTEEMQDVEFVCTVNVHGENQFGDYEPPELISIDTTHVNGEEALGHDEIQIIEDVGVDKIERAACEQARLYALYA